MRNFPTRYFVPILFLLLIVISLWKFPFATPLISVFFVCFSLVIAIVSIIKKHKCSENPYRKIAKDILILLFTLLLAIALGGLAGRYANQYTSLHFGVIIGIMTALATSFYVGYLVKRGLGMVLK